jgi:predicted permease
VLASLLQDLKFGFKLLLKDKGFTVTALFTLALCIGANASIFTVINAVLLRPLPFPEPERLVMVYNSYPGIGVEKASNGVPDYLDRKKEDVFESIALIGYSGYDLGSGGAPERILGEYVTPSFFRVLRVAPAFGRAFTEEEATQGKDKVVILGYGLWKERFGGNLSVLGTDVRLSGVPYRIVGIMPESFEPLSSTSRLWVPFAFTPQQTSDKARHSNSWTMIARLKPGVSVALAQQRIDALNKRIAERFPQMKRLLENARFRTAVVNLHEELVSDAKPTLILLQGAVAFVLLIGCVNVANLMLVRSSIRTKELAIRFSLGAGRLRLSRQLLTESVLLALAGGALGLAAAIWGVRLLNHLGADRLPRGATIHIDATVLGVTALAAVATGILFGLVPVARIFRGNLNHVFRGTERGGTAERPAIFTRAVLVVCQVALAFTLLIGAGLLSFSFRRVLAVDPGFKPDGVLAASVLLPQSRYSDDASARAFFTRLLEASRSVPGVRHAGITSFLPFGGGRNASVITIDGYVLSPGENPPVPGYNTIDSDYLRVMGIPLLRGRMFSESDTETSQPVVMIDRFLAEKYWPKGDPIGARIRRGIGNDNPLLTIVGVVENVKTTGLADQNAVGQVYFHYRQSPPRNVHLVVKGERADASFGNAIRRELMRIDPELPLEDVLAMPERVSRSLLDRRAPMVLCLVFAGVALVLAAVGIYGVLAYTVAQRTREFGIRMALGAQAGAVLGMVFRQGLRLAFIGLAAGLAASYFLTRLMTSLLFQVKPGDPIVFIAVSGVLASVAVIASLVPSFRAMRIDPVVALRYE